MSLRSGVVVIGLFVLFFITGAGGNMAAAQQDSNNQGQPLMTPVSGPVANEPADSRESFVHRLGLRIYEAETGNLSLCAEDKFCLEDANYFKSWLCAASVCNGTDKSKKPIACFSKKASDKFSIEVTDQIDASICPFIKSPNAKTRQALLIHMPSNMEDELLDIGAYLLALKGSAASCEDYIKNYAGAYGPQWEYQWYRAMSGCRILTHESTREQEEEDFYTWFKVAQGSGHCSNIMNSEMRKACNALGSTLPALVYNAH